jgi:exopolysaccharide production protein ExoQ
MRSTSVARRVAPIGVAAGRPPRAIRDTRHRALAVLIIWLLIWRLVIPGFFEYGDGISAKDFAAMVEQEALFNNIVWMGLLALGLLIIGSRSGLALSVARSLNFFLVCLLVLVTMSVLWSVDPKATSARLTHAIIIAVDCAAVSLAGGWNPRRYQEMVRPVLTAILVGSLIFGLLYPELAISPPIPPDTRYYWHGLTTHKNQLGGIAGTATVFWIHAWLAKETSFFKALAGGGSAVACLLLARSSTAWMATAFAVMFMLLLMRSPPSLRRYMPYVVGAFALLVLAYALAVLRLVPGLDVLLLPITAMTGKDTTFTDRTTIWQVIENHIRLSPLLGTGYGGYWVGPFPTSASYVFLSILFIYPWESHNGYLDIVNDLGYVGIALLIGYIIVFIKQSLRLMQTSRTQAALYLGLMFQGLLANLSESGWFKPDWWFVVMTFATFALARGLVDSRTQAQSARRR